MAHGPSRRPSLLLLVAAGTALLCAAPGAAVAGCHFGLVAGRSPARLDRLAALGALAGPIGGQLPAVPSCPGGVCSRGAEQPTAPAPSVLPGHDRDVWDQPSESDLASARSPAKLDREHPERPRIAPTRLDRPPRTLVGRTG